MPPPDPPPGSAEDWLRRAHSDLALACLPRPPGVLLEDLCFHTQQAAEKALKAVLVARSGPVPRTHSIPRLLELMPQAAVPETVQEAAILTDYAVSARYPGLLEPIEEDELERAIALAEGVVAWASQQIAEPEKPDPEVEPCDQVAGDEGGKEKLSR